jgi:putative transposase
MERRNGHNTYKYTLKPAPEQERALEHVLSRRRTLYNAALEERKTAWERCQISVTYYRQKADVPDVKVACPQYAEVNAPILLNGATAKAWLNKSFNDAGYYSFRAILAGKAAWAGKRVEAVRSAYTLQDCSGCGARRENEPQSANSYLSYLRPHAGPRSERGAHHPMGRAGTAGTCGVPAEMNREAPSR